MQDNDSSSYGCRLHLHPSTGWAFGGVKKERKEMKGLITPNHQPLTTNHRSSAPSLVPLHFPASFVGGLNGEDEEIHLPKAEK